MQSSTNKTNYLRLQQTFGNNIYVRCDKHFFAQFIKSKNCNHILRDLNIWANRKPAPGWPYLPELLGIGLFGDRNWEFSRNKHFEFSTMVEQSNQFLPAGEPPLKYTPKKNNFGPGNLDSDVRGLLVWCLIHCDGDRQVREKIYKELLHYVNVHQQNGE